MKIESIIKLSESVDNKERRFGGSLEYYPVYIISENGNATPALFTKDQIKVATERAERNAEDVPEKDGGFFFGLFT